MPEKSTKKNTFCHYQIRLGEGPEICLRFGFNLPKDRFETIVAGGGQGIMAEKIMSAGLPFMEIKSFQET